jgi:hypothetical protein
MALSEQDRREILADIGLAADGEALTLLERPEIPAKTVAAKVVKQPIQTDVKTPDVEALTDEQLLAADAFERYKLRASEVGRAISSPHNKRLHARIIDAKDRLRKSEQEMKRNAKDQRKKEDRTHVRDKVKADTANRAAQGVLEAMKEAGIDLDQLAELLREDAS